MTTKPTIQERVADADARGSRWLAKANEAKEHGNHKAAERYYTKGQYWLDRSNSLRGLGRGKNDNV